MPFTEKQIAAADAGGFAPAVKYADLKATHPDYDAEEIADYEALYQGGKLFKARIEKFLIKRDMEKGGGNAARVNTSKENPGVGEAANAGGANCKGMYEARKACAWYAPIIAGLLDFIRAAVLSSKPVIVAAEKKSIAEKVKSIWDKIASIWGQSAAGETSRAQYYTELNRDCDGCGNSLVSEEARLLNSLELHGRAYLGVRFPDVCEDVVTELDAQMAGAYDGKLCFYGAAEIDNWCHDDEGDLAWIRRHVVKTFAPNPTSPMSFVREIWCYITPAALFTYQVEYDAAAKPDDAELVNLVSIQPHDCGEMPVKEIPVDIHVCKRLAPTAIALYNRQASVTWALNTMAYSILCAICEEDPAGIIGDQSFITHLKPGAGVSLEWKTPNPQIFDSLAKDRDELTGRMYESIQAMVLNAASMASNGRQSADAKRHDFGAFEVFLEVFAEPLRTTLEWATKLLQRQRGDEDLIIHVEGLDTFDIDQLDQKLDQALKYLGMEDMPETARRWVKLDASLAMLKKAPPEICKAVVEECAAGGTTAVNDIGKVPLALQQLALARQRYVDTGEIARADKLSKKMDELVDSIN